MSEEQRKCEVCGGPLEADRLGVCRACRRRANASLPVEMLRDGRLQDIQRVEDGGRVAFMAWPSLRGGLTRRELPYVTASDPVDAAIAASDLVASALNTQAKQEEANGAAG